MRYSNCYQLTLTGQDAMNSWDIASSNGRPRMRLTWHTVFWALRIILCLAAAPTVWNKTRNNGESKYMIKQVCIQHSILLWMGSIFCLYNVPFKTWSAAEHETPPQQGTKPRTGKNKVQFHTNTHHEGSGVGQPKCYCKLKERMRQSYMSQLQ